MYILKDHKWHRFNHSRPSQGQSVCFRHSLGMRCSAISRLGDSGPSVRSRANSPSRCEQSRCQQSRADLGACRASEDSYRQWRGGAFPQDANDTDSAHEDRIGRSSRVRIAVRRPHGLIVCAPHDIVSAEISSTFPRSYPVRATLRHAISILERRELRTGTCRSAPCRSPRCRAPPKVLGELGAESVARKVPRE